MKRRAFNTCLKHVINKHAWEQTTETSLYTSCGHAPLQASRQEALTEGSRASSRFREMLLNRRLQEDLLKASSHGVLPYMRLKMPSIDCIAEKRSTTPSRHTISIVRWLRCTLTA
ncbi:hypothetical protein RB195_006756 [Necator americanus]|uniref:Uncharacterized protein n=1 Tax=Necator americanus TaxID=51031 RepID=A0ABR1BU33_NECAM